MFVYLWNYFKGYVIVEITGLKMEKFLNGALRDGNYFWDVRYVGDKVILKTTIDGFKHLKPIAYRSKCRVRIVEKHGLPFISFKYRKRRIFAAGSLLFVGLFWMLTSFVWLVEIDGNNLLQETDIIDTLKEGGYTTGKLKSKLDLREAEQYLINQHNEILWAGISFIGTKLNVQITEAVQKPIMHNETDPTNIVATRDGIITYIATSSGMPQVKKGDTVKKGDILVSGAVPLESEVLTGTNYVNADATILARTLYSLEAQQLLEKETKYYIPDISTTYSIKIFDTQFDIFKKDLGDVAHDTLVTINQLKLTSMFPMPFYFIKTEQVPFTMEAIVQEQTLVEDKLEGALNDALLEKIGNTGKIVKKEITYEVVDGIVIGRLYALVEEDISVESPITQDEMLNQTGGDVNVSN
ncbi:MAG: sporulation protein YqfD [Epulopiscium sp. Nuni2H_MBin003]|nr:MAG: sporulation protein YqfD [Epulopiscium sp. Nuni2H_MBin003]